MAVRIQTSGNNVTATSALFRVDTVTPTEHMVVLTHSISKATVESQKHLLLASLQNLFPANTRVGIWRITETTTTARRRLLASTSQSTMYVVNSVSADTQSGIDGNKPFMSQDNILNVLRESPDGTPSSVLTTPTFATFPVTSVDPSTEFVISDTESWPETTEGIAVLTTIGLTILIAVLFTVIYCVCTYRGRKYKLKEENEEVTKSTTKVRPEKKYSTQESFIINNIPPEALPVIPTYRESLQHQVYNPRKNSKNNEVPVRKTSKHVSVTELNHSTVTDDVPPKLFHPGGRRERSDISRREGVVTPRNIMFE